MSGPTVVCVPDRNAVDLLGDLPDSVEVMVWDGRGDPPPGIDRAVFWVPQVDDAGDLAAMFAAMPNVRVVQVTSAGVDDVAAGIPDDVLLCDARGVHGTSVAELVVLMILADRRQLPHFLDAQRAGRWDLVQGRDLVDARVLVVGAGDLGEQTATRLRAFAARPVMVARTARDGVHGFDELADLLPDADVVVLTLPLTAQTRGMVDAGFLARMVDGALLVNVARGAVVDTDALLAELRSGRLHAALDVVDPEPLPDGHELWSVPGVIVTPHAAGHVEAAGRRAFALVTDQIRRLVDGAELINVVQGDY